MNYSLFLITLFVILLIIYLRIKRTESDSPVVILEDFNTESLPTYRLTREQRDKIINQKITHKNVSFFAYLVSLAVCFGLGGVAIFKIVQQMDFKLLQDAMFTTAGVASTIGFRGLYVKCEKDLNNLR